MKKTSPKKPSSLPEQKKTEGGPAVLHPTHQSIAYTPQLNQTKPAVKKKEEESEPDEMD